jgi:ribosomal protein L37AE/L43A
MKIIGDKTDICKVCKKQTRVHCLKFYIDFYIWICENCLFAYMKKLKIKMKRENGGN